MPNSTQAAKMLSDVLGRPQEICLHVTRRLGEDGLIHRGSRGRSAQPVTARELAIMTIAVMATTDGTTPVVQAPKLAERIATLDAGPGGHEIIRIGDDQTPIAFGSYVSAIADGLEGRDSITGAVTAFGLQFCRGEVRAWIEWSRMESRVWFGFRKTHPGMVQDISVGPEIIDALRPILSNTPTQRQTGSAPFAKSPSAAKRRPIVHPQNVREHSLERETSQGPGGDSPHTTNGGFIHHGTESHRRAKAA